MRNTLAVGILSAALPLTSSARLRVWWRAQSDGKPLLRSTEDPSGHTCGRGARQTRWSIPKPPAFSLLVLPGRHDSRTLPTAIDGGRTDDPSANSEWGFSFVTGFLGTERVTANHFVTVYHVDPTPTKPPIPPKCPPTDPGCYQ